MAPSVSVSIPTYKGPIEVLQQAIMSPAAQLTRDQELVIAPQGAEPEEATRAVSLPRTARMPTTVPESGIVSNWNRCLSESRSQLKHLLHDDDGRSSTSELAS